MNRICLIKISTFSLLFTSIVPLSAAGLTLSNSISASSVTVTGDVTVSSMSVSTITVTNLDVQGAAIGIKGLILQTVFASSTATNTTTSSTLTAVSGMSASIALHNASNYVRISISGILKSDPDPGSLVGQYVNLSIERDSTDLGQGALISTNNLEPVGIAIVDFPNDTNLHTYRVTFSNGGGSTQIAEFTASPLAYLLLEEISQ